MKGTDRVGTFLWKLFSDLFLYSAEMVPEISDRIVEIDRAMRWGYANKLGPFELWDALGFEDVCERLESDKREIPENIAEDAPSRREVAVPVADSAANPGTEYFDLAGASISDLEERPGIMVLSDLKRARGVVKQNAGASLIDLGDGVLCVEFHSKMNSLGEDQIGMLYAGLEETEKNFEAMVIANQGENFSVGANLMLVLLAAQEGEWDDLNARDPSLPADEHGAEVRAQAGGGRAVRAIAGRRLRDSAALRRGAGVGGNLHGLGGGGRGPDSRRRRLQGNAAAVEGSRGASFELIGMAKVSTSAEEARQLGFLRVPIAFR